MAARMHPARGDARAELLKHRLAILREASIRREFSIGRIEANRSSCAPILFLHRRCDVMRADAHHKMRMDEQRETCWRCRYAVIGTFRDGHAKVYTTCFDLLSAEAHDSRGRRLQPIKLQTFGLMSSCPGRITRTPPQCVSSSSGDFVASRPARRAACRAMCIAFRRSIQTWLATNRFPNSAQRYSFGIGKAGSGYRYRRRLFAAGAPASH